MNNNEEKKEHGNTGYQETSGTGVLSSIIFAIVATVVLSIVAYFVK